MASGYACRRRELLVSFTTYIHGAWWVRMTSHGVFFAPRERAPSTRTALQAELHGYGDSHKTRIAAVSRMCIAISITKMHSKPAARKLSLTCMP